ncbi:MarR family winged helix-turn-helix transcriptional regulator [uncultured Veillonella sp.]|uniref:MarR family winged helix-turn-helix transcriptional regulator n=1 Tax=uncultured Veillonella sp. TaxID=159268 RepID=UPI0026150DA8|nr:MarR family transcriptional regulator [uncultured Veillonella sp.]
MSSIDRNILIRLHRNVGALDRKTARIAAKYKLTFSQFMVLEALYSKGNLTVGEVRRAILSSIGTISVIINNLVKMGYIERLADATDKRVSILQLTEAGHAVISNIVPENNAMIQNSFEVLTHEEKMQLVNLLKVLGEQLDEENN